MIATAEHTERSIRLRATLEHYQRDPLLTYQHSSWASEWVCDNIHRAWIYWHAANSGGKSKSLGALDVALLRGLPTLGGRPIPEIKPPIHGALGTPTYKLGAAGSVIDVVRELIGAIPCHEERVAGSVSVFHIKHALDTGDEWQRWSSHLYVFPYGGPIPEGVRLDFWHADEPPPENWLSAILNRGKAGRRLYGYIGATPIIRRLWEPIKTQFPKEHLQIINGRARVQSSVYDNRFLSPEDIQRQEYANPPEHPLSRAKLYGDHCNTSGACPFDVATLAKLLKECREPRIIEWPVEYEVRNNTGMVKVLETVRVELFKPRQVNRAYFGTIDPSSGVNDPAHHPAEMDFVDDETGDLVARWHGKMSGFAVGVLAAGLARRYNDAKLNPEVNDRWGVNVVEGIMSTGYANFAREERELRPGEFSQEIGFHNTGKTRPMIIGAIQTWLEARKAGVVYAECPSRAVLEALLDTELDENNKVVPIAAAPHHGEAMICWGENLRKVCRYVGAEAREMEVILTPQEIAEEYEKAAWRELTGEPAQGVPGGSMIRVPKRRWH